MPRTAAFLGALLGIAAAGCGTSLPSGDGAIQQANTTDDAGIPGTTSGARTFPARWDDGTDCTDKTPGVDVWAYEASTYILRQSLCTSFEGPFIYLFVGKQRALLLDTGTGDADLKTPVMALVNRFRIGADPIELVVAHSHAHGDHVGGDAQFAGVPNVTVVGSTPAAVREFFGFEDWPAKTAAFDLGERMLDIIAIPGHEASHIAVFDRQEKLLLTGDTLYPGRLYVRDWTAYRASTQRLVDFASKNPVTWVLGGHIEMPQEGADYAMSASRHSREHALALDPAEVTNLNDAVAAMGSKPRRETHSNFVVYPL